MADAVFTVRHADERGGLFAIARLLHGDSARWIELFEDNRVTIGDNPARIRAGQQLIVRGLPYQPLGHNRAYVYVVQLRDVSGGLGHVAAQCLGDAARWVEIYAVNRGVIGDSPELLRVGQHLVILPDAEQGF